MNYFECKTCGFDSDEAGSLSPRSEGICPLCAGDCGVDNWMRYRPATEEELKRFGNAP